MSKESPPLSLSVHARADEISRADWARLTPPGHPFLNVDFLSICERHGPAGRPCGWMARHLAVRGPGGDVVGLLPLYLRQNSHGDFVNDWSWAAAYRQLGRTYYPKLLSGLPHTPAGGPRLLVAPGVDPAPVRERLIEGALVLARELGVSSWHVAFPDEADRDALGTAGLLLSRNVQFHWLAGDCTDFDDYLATFAAEKRRKVRAERRRVRESGLAFEVRHGDAVDPAEWPALHALYASTFEKFGNLAVFSGACLAELGATLGGRMLLFIARERGEPVALSLCLRSDDTLYGRYWGCRGNTHSLHFELCFYQGIEYCLRHGLKRFEPGAGGEHKIARGFVPTVVHAAHWIADPTMRRLIGQHLERQVEAVADYREEAASHLPFRRAPG